MRSTPVDLDDAAQPVSSTRLYGLATLLGYLGLATLLVQALFWIPPGHAYPPVLLFTALTPFLSALVFTLIPRRYPLETAAFYAWSQPLVYLTLAAPVVVSALSVVLIAASGSFDDYFGFVLALGALAGSDLKNFVYCLLSNRSRS